MFSKLLIALVLLTPAAWAQRNEVGVILGAYVPVGSTLDVGPGFALEGSFAHRIASVPLLSAYLELPVAGSFHTSFTSFLGSSSNSVLFITPGVKLKLAPSFPISPYLVAGVGYGHFHAAAPALDTSTNRFTADIGGGMDIKVFPHVRLRGEVRDFHSSSPGSLLGFIGLTGHNIIAGGGLALGF